MANETYATIPAPAGCRQQPPAADETGVRPPWAPDGACGGRDVWIYQEPRAGADYGGRAEAPAAVQPPVPNTRGTEGENMPGMTVPDGTADGMAAPMPGMNGGDTGGGMSSDATQQERMRNPVSMSGTHMPANAKEAYQASLRSLLERNTGYFVVATFQIGSNQAVTWQGILYSVGSDYLVLYQPDYRRYISCDIYSLKFVQFHNVKGVPYCAGAQSWQGQTSY